MNCSYCHGEFGPLPPIAVFVDTALAGEFCSVLCLHRWIEANEELDTIQQGTRPRGELLQ
jgi:hypothetical protein